MAVTGEETTAPTISDCLQAGGGLLAHATSTYASSSDFHLVRSLLFSKPFARMGQLRSVPLSDAVLLRGSLIDRNLSILKHWRRISTMTTCISPMHNLQYLGINLVIIRSVPKLIVVFHAAGFGSVP